jgi:hypothetical protein
MKRVLWVLMATGLAACGGGGMSDSSTMNPDSAMSPPTAAPAAFAAVVPAA